LCSVRANAAVSASNALGEFAAGASCDMVVGAALRT
jgi:hypothetical protein